MTTRRPRVAALSCVLLTCALLGAAWVLWQRTRAAPGVRGDTNVVDLSMLGFVVALCGSGLLIAWHRPRNSVGWLLIGGGLMQALSSFGEAYGARALAFPREELPLGTWVMALLTPLWLVGLLVPTVFLLLRYPSGSVVGVWGRRLDRVLQASVGVLWLSYAAGDFVVSDAFDGGTSPLDLPEVLAPLGAANGVVVVVGMLLAVVHTIVRTVRAKAPERQQLVLLVSIVPLGLAVMALPWEIPQLLLFGLPFGVTVGVLRYHLLGIDVVVRRSLLYGSLTGLVLLVFAAVTAAFALVAPGSEGAALVASGVVAVSAIPARDVLQRQVDRLVYGDRGDPIAALRRVARPVSDAEGAALVRDLLGAVALAVRAPWGHVVTASGALVEVGDAADTGAACVRRPLTVGGEEVGELALGLRRGESRLPAADDRLLEALTPVLAVVLRGAELTARVRVEQARALAATGVERDRLRRDLHDGLGPALTGMGLGLEALEARHGASPLLDRLRAECSGALEEVRRILDDLRPAALDDGDLLEAVRSRVARWEATSDVPVHLTLPERAGPVAAADATVVRILDEALTNVAKHAHATRCDVGLEVDLDAGTMVLRVRDDGVGVGDGVREGAVGLASMRARAEALGGELRVEPAGPGTCVVARLPVPHGALT